MDKTTPEHRYRFIELVAWWEGQINTTHLTQQFGLSRQQSSADLKSYNQTTHDNLRYDPSKKAWLPAGLPYARGGVPRRHSGPVSMAINFDPPEGGFGHKTL